MQYQAVEARHDWPTIVEAKRDYAPSPPGMGGPIKLTIATVKEVVDDMPLNKAAAAILTANVGAVESQVAAMLLWTYAAPDSLVMSLHAANWYAVPLKDWKRIFSDEVDMMRRTLSTPRASPDEEGYLWMRKIFNITYRGTEEADWESEYRKTNVEIPHRSIRDLANKNVASYHVLFEQEAAKLIKDVVTQYSEAGQHDSIAEWWEARAAWAPGGSTSRRGVVKQAVGDHPELSKQDRPDKKAAVESMDIMELLDALVSAPSLHARASTKQEPGHKARALYAVEDNAFFIASYASLDLEKYMDIEGMNARQTPADVASWVAADYGHKTRPKAMWYSLDYSDFNKEHRLWEIRLLNLLFAREWLKSNLPMHIRYQKSVCAEWVANATAVSTVTRGDTSFRVWSGLFSGSRDTARDNTLLHCIYSNMVLQLMQYRGIPRSILYKRCMCGDDEDALFSKWGILAIYAHLHTYIGWQLKPSKQMCGPRHHEYLQRTVIGDRLPQRPICTLLETIATGNWYVRPAIWYDSAVSAVSDNAWELHLRGLSLAYARRLAYITLNAMMRVPGPQGSTEWLKLEWWSQRHMASKTPLWVNTGDDGWDNPIEIQTKTDPGEQVIALASQDLVLKSWQILKNLDDGAIAAFKAAKRTEAYSKLFTTNRLRILERKTREEWPERTSIVDKSLFSNGLSEDMPERAVIVRACATHTRSRRPSTEQEVLSRMRLDPDAVSLAGGLLGILHELRPQQLSNYTRPTEKLKPTIKGYYLDSALRSWVYSDSYVPTSLVRAGY